MLPAEVYNKYYVPPMIIEQAEEAASDSGKENSKHEKN
jgi:hypothetical protein